MPSQRTEDSFESTLRDLCNCDIKLASELFSIISAGFWPVKSYPETREEGYTIHHMQYSENLKKVKFSMFSANTLQYITYRPNTYANFSNNFSYYCTEHIM